MTNSTTIVSTSLEETYANFAQILRKILDSITNLGYSIILLKDNTINLLDEDSKFLLSLKTVVLERSKDLKLQCVMHLDDAAFEHLKFIHRDLHDRSYLKYDLGPVGEAAWNALSQVLSTVNVAKSFIKTVNASDKLVVSIQVSVLNQVDNVLEYKECYLTSSRALILEIPDFFGTNKCLNLVCYVKMNTSERGELVYKAAVAPNNEKSLKIKNSIVLSEPTPKPVSYTKSLFLDAVDMFEKMAFDSMVP